MGNYEYNDSYATCVTTYSTLRVFSESISPDEITGVLQIEPTDRFRNGESRDKGRFIHKTNGWFYSTEKLSSSKDTRRHIDLILTALEGREEAIQKLLSMGCRIDISSYWGSVGHGGPWLMPEQMLKLGTLGIEVWWDVYLLEDEGEGGDASEARPNSG